MSVESGQAFFGNCTRKLFVSFMKPRSNPYYSVCVRLRNDRDTHPLDLGQMTTIIRKRATGFEVELSQHTDSPYYAIDYSIMELDNRDMLVDSNGMLIGSERFAIEKDSGPPPFKKECTCESRVLFHSGCKCGAFKKEKKA